LDITEGVENIVMDGGVRMGDVGMRMGGYLRIARKPVASRKERRTFAKSLQASSSSADPHEPPSSALGTEANSFVRNKVKKTTM